MCLCSQPRFPSPGFQTSLPTPASQWLWLEGGAVLPGGSGMQEMGTLWPRGHFGTIAGSRRGRAGFCFLLCAPFPLGIGSPWGLEAGGIGGGGGRRLGAACERFVLWCNQYSLILFDFFFFSLLFVVAIFHVSTVSAVFSPYSRPPLSLVINQKPETRNHSGCKGPLLGHWSRVVPSSSRCFQAVNPTRAARATLCASLLPPSLLPVQNPPASLKSPSRKAKRKDFGKLLVGKKKKK